MFILCTVRLQADDDTPALMSPLPNVLWQQISPSAMCPGEWQPHPLHPPGIRDASISRQAVPSSSPRPLQCPLQWPVSAGMISLAFWPKLLFSLEMPFPCQGTSRLHNCLEDHPVCVRLKLTLKLIIQFFLPITHPSFLPQLRFICHTNTWQVSSPVSSTPLHLCILFYSFCVQDNLSS